MMYVALGRILIALILAMNVPSMLGFEPIWWFGRVIAFLDLGAIVYLAWTAFGHDDDYFDDDDDLLYGA